VNRAGGAVPAPAGGERRRRPLLLNAKANYRSDEIFVKIKIIFT
jgi:hypothetical protein